MTAFTPPLSQLAAAVPSADMTVRGFAARLPKMEVLSRALHRSTSNQHRLPSDRRTEEPYRRSRGLRSEPPWSFAHHQVLMGIARAALRVRPERLTSSSSAATVSMRKIR